MLKALYVFLELSNSMIIFEFLRPVSEGELQFEWIHLVLHMWELNVVSGSLLLSQGFLLVLFLEEDLQLVT